MIERAQVQTGMQVRDAAGTKLGKVTSFDSGTIRIEKKSVFGDREYVVRYSDIDRAADGELRLRVSVEELRARLGAEPDAANGETLIGIETDVTSMDASGRVTRYEEHVVGISEQGGDVEEREVVRSLPNRHAREASSVRATGTDGTPGDEDPPRAIDEDEQEELGQAPDLAHAVAEHP